MNFSQEYRKISDYELITKIYGEDLIKKILSILIDKHALLIYGPPGTGKTTLARILANELGAEFRQVTVHGWFTRFNWIGGHVIEHGETIWKDGILLETIKSNRKTLILLDEINRGEPERFLAEIFTALSDPELKFEVPEIKSKSVLFLISAGHPINVVWSIYEWKLRCEEHSSTFEECEEPIIWGYESSKSLRYIDLLRREYSRLYLAVYIRGRFPYRMLGFLGEIYNLGSVLFEKDETYFDEPRWRYLVLLKPILVNKLLIDPNTSYRLLKLSSRKKGIIEKVEKELTINQLREYVKKNKIKIANLAAYAMPDILKELVKMSKESQKHEFEFLNESIDPQLLEKLGNYVNFLILSDEEKDNLRREELYLIEKEKLSLGNNDIKSINDIVVLYDKYDVLKNFYILNRRVKPTWEARFSLDQIYIVATANSADVGALGRLGFALLRRFPTIELIFDLENDKHRKGFFEVLGATCGKEALKYRDEISKLWSSIRSILEEKVGEELIEWYLPGFAYFLDYAQFRLKGLDIQESFKIAFYGYIRNLNLTRYDIEKIIRSTQTIS